MSNDIKHLDITDDMFTYMGSLSTHLKMQTVVGKSRQTEESVKSIMTAVRLLKQEAASIRVQSKYLKSRVKNQSTVLFSFLTHQDSVTNIQLANAGKELAEATRRDGSSMKTVAVLTMGFPPATFLAALFSMPSLGWDQPDKFVIYWACAIPMTAVTFVLWAGITQRKQMAELLKAIRERRYPEKQNTTKGAEMQNNTEITHYMTT
ncbi:hypothetical protein QBC44DRAFT_390254 [Cladorrhinum sp. PSN332]|nr:hypothetical protein QBC44DRAFT_390254 [Cladorrhinum sp. PSN332]